MTAIDPALGASLPEPKVADYATAKDGCKLRYAIFRAQRRPVLGTVIVLHGRNECIEKYGETISDITARGFDVATFDWRGQGRSTRLIKNPLLGYVDDFEQYADDLDFMFSEYFLAETRAPFYILAHSAGALIALLAAPRMVNRIRRMVLSAPFLALGDDAPSSGLMLPVTHIAAFFGLGTMPMNRKMGGMAAVPFERNILTTDPVRYRRNQEICDPKNGLGLGPPTVTWLKAALDAQEKIKDPDHMAMIHIPTLMLNAGADRIVAGSAIDDYANRIRSGALITIDGARHELMQEADRYREQFFAAFDAFIPGTPTLS